jgi:hypothetical protein
MNTRRHGKLELPVLIVLIIEAEIAKAMNDAFRKEPEKFQVQALKAPAMLVAAEDAFHLCAFEWQVYNLMGHLHDV